MEQKAWVIDVNMGYGHQRTAFPLRGIEHEGVIHANDYAGIPDHDKNIWDNSRNFYEAISRFKRVPLIGETVFNIYNELQKIDPFYPRRNLSGFNTLYKHSYFLIQKGWGKHLIEKLSKKPLPLVSTFFTPAFMAEEWKYPGEIYCIVCDTDIARAWAPLDPTKSRIKYFAPTWRAVERLQMYGVRNENIFFTGYPLPEECIGDESQSILKKDIKNRLVNLDPLQVYYGKYKSLITAHLGKMPAKSDHPLTLMFAVGGAGAQKEMALKIITGLRRRMENQKIKIILVAGSRGEVKEYFDQAIKKLKLPGNIQDNIEILYDKTVDGYFAKFNQAIRTTDILWTKPSELSFYSGLGLPIVILPTIGYQEEFNKDWLVRNSFGILPEKIEYIDEWLFDFINNGLFADCAMQGFIEGQSLGTHRIKHIIAGKQKSL